MEYLLCILYIYLSRNLQNKIKHNYRVLRSIKAQEYFCIIQRFNRLYFELMRRTRLYLPKIGVLIMDGSKPKMNENQDEKDPNANVKDFIIFGWMLVLISISILAIGGNISRLVAELSGVTEKAISPEKIKSSCSYGLNPTPTEYLNCYTAKNYTRKFSENIPPIGTILDSIQVNTSWREPNPFEDQVQVLVRVKRENYKIAESEYIVLFQIVETKLNAFAANELQDINISTLNISNEILPAKFRGDGFMAKNISIPLEAQNWLIAQKDKRRQLKLVDTFGLLIMLGALGSIIFLIREHIDPEKKTLIRSYIYKPIFGILLAIATFVVNLSVNGLTSTAKVEDLRTEGILLLAFTAGLLSDETYEKLTKESNKKSAGEAMEKSAGEATEKPAGESEVNS